MILDQRDLRRMREALVGEVLEHLGVLLGGVAIRHLHLPAARFGRDRHTGLPDRLFRGLVQTNHWAIRVVRADVDRQ